MEHSKNLIAQKISRISALLVVFILGFIRPATAQVDFPIGYVSRGGTYAFISLIEQHKLLEQEGIRPTFVYIGGPQVSQALISGDIRMAIVAAASPIRAAAHGADLRFVGGVTDKEVASFVAESSIKTPAELKGTRLAIDRFGDYSDFRARKVLEMFGLQAQKDVTLLQIGAQTARFAALRNGHVQSTFVVPPLTLVARKAGLARTRRSRRTRVSLVVGSLRRHAIERRKKSQRDLRRAPRFVKAIRLYKADKEQALGAIARFMRLNDREALEEHGA